MKYLKKFEELSPELIRKAGNQLISKGHIERGLDLLDKSYSGNEPLNVWITDNGSFLKRLPKVEERSEAVPLSYYFSSSKFYFYPRNNTYELSKENMDAEKLIQYWEEGKCDLAFNIDFYFKPTKETIKSVKFSYEKDFDKQVALFNLNFLIHKKISGNENVGAESYIKNHLLKRKLSKDNTYMQEYFNKVNKEDVIITLNLPCIKDLPTKEYGRDNEFGLFSDRKSALKFKNIILPKVIDEQGDKIMDILSILNMNGDKADGILNFYKKVTVNYLYRSEIPHTVSISSDVEYYFFDRNKGKDIRS